MRESGAGERGRAAAARRTYDGRHAAIRIADCNNSAGLANVLFDECTECTKMNVCGTP